MDPMTAHAAVARPEIISPPKEREIPYALLATFLTGVALFIFILAILLRPQKTKRRKLKKLDEKLPWAELFETADRTIKEVIADRPPEVRTYSDKVSFLLQKWCPHRKNLGMFYNMSPGKISDSNGPIFIYVGQHYLYCRKYNLDFETEIRRTYLHELCHHFGLDENEIQERGLA